MGSWLLTGNALGVPPQGVFGTTDNNAVVIETNGQERVRVDTSGRVGIGTTSPVSPLDVRSASRIASLYSTTNGNQWVEVGNTVTHMNLGVGALAPTAGVPYIWSASGNFMIGNDGGPTLFIQGMGNGKVGIGTTSPASPLDVNGNVTVRGTLTAVAIDSPTITALQNQLTNLQNQLNTAINQINDLNAGMANADNAITNLNNEVAEIQEELGGD